MPKQPAIKKRGRPRKRWTDEVEEHLNTDGIRNRQGLVRHSSGME
jgi:AT hook motif.